MIYWQIEKDTEEHGCGTPTITRPKKPPHNWTEQSLLMFTALRAGWVCWSGLGSAVEGPAWRCQLHVLSEPVPLSSLRSQADGTRVDLDMVLTVVHGAQESNTNHTKTFQDSLTSCQLTSHWPKQVTWPSPKSRCAEQASYHEAVARVGCVYLIPPEKREEWGQ